MRVVHATRLRIYILAVYFIYCFWGILLRKFCTARRTRTRKVMAKTPRITTAQYSIVLPVPPVPARITASAGSTSLQDQTTMYVKYRRYPHYRTLNTARSRDMNGIEHLHTAGISTSPVSSEKHISIRITKPHIFT